MPWEAGREAGEVGSYRTVTEARSPKRNGNHLDSCSRRMAYSRLPAMLHPRFQITKYSKLSEEGGPLHSAMYPKSTEHF